MNIFKLIPLVMADIGSVSKDRRNEQQKYQFRGIEDMYKAAHPAFVKHGVFCVPEVLEHHIDVFERSNEFGKVTYWRHAILKVKHQFYAEDGSHVDVITMGEGLDNSDKAVNKAMSGAMKYALIELFSTPTEDVEDADRTSPEAGKSVTLAPIPPIKNVPEETPEIPADVDGGSPYITTRQRSYLGRRFRESINPEHEKRADEFRHAALTALEQSGLFKSKFHDEHGNPTSDFILVQEYAAVGKALVQAAKSI